MTDDQFAKLLNTIMSGQRDHDILVRMDANLKNHLANCEFQKQHVSTHMAESVDVRDDVTRCRDFVGGAKKALWIMFASLVGIAYKVFFIK